MLQKKRYEDHLTNEQDVRKFSSQFAFADFAIRKAVHLIKSGKAEQDGMINVATEVLEEMEHCQLSEIK